MIPRTLAQDAKFLSHSTANFDLQPRFHFVKYGTAVTACTRWADVVQTDARQLLGIRGWRSKAANRDEWRRLMREAKAWKGLQRHRWMVATCGNEVLQSTLVRQKLRMKICHLSVSLPVVPSHSVHIRSALSRTVDFTFYIPSIMIRLLQCKPTKCTHFSIITFML